MTYSLSYLEVPMMAHSKFFSTVARCSLFAVAMAVVGLTWGCSGDVPQAPLDGAAQARVKEAQDAQKKFMANKKAIKNPSRRRQRGEGRQLSDLHPSSIV